MKGSVKSLVVLKAVKARLLMYQHQELFFVLQTLPSVDFQTLLYILLVIGGLSGWIALIFDRLSEKPKIRGRIVQVMRGQFKNPENPLETLTSFTIFLYLTNTRKSSAQLIDYALLIPSGRFRFQRMKILLGTLDNLHFGYQGRELNIPDLNQRLLNHQTKPVELGASLTGFLIFLGDASYYKADIQKYRLICTDVFGRKHKIVNKAQTVLRRKIHSRHVWGKRDHLSFFASFFSNSESRRTLA